jgi:hypothetical protein
MRKHAAKKLSLSRETLHRLTTASLAGVVGATDGEIGAGAVEVDKNLSIQVCTNVISDCVGCTTPLASCPRTMFSYCTCA